MDEFTNTPKKRGRPRLTPEEKAERARLRKAGELPTVRRSDKVNFGQEYVEKGDNSKYLQHALVVRGMPPIDLANPKDVERRIDWYFNQCIADDMKPSVKGFCNALKISRSTLWNWRTGAFRAGTHEEVIVRGYDVLEALWEDYMQNGKINPMAGVFLGVNNYGYKDVKQVNVTPVTDSQPERLDVAAIEAKYAELPDVEG